MVKVKNEKIELENNEIDIKQELNMDEIVYKEEYCTVLWKKTHAFGIDFKDFGISFHTSEEHFLDTSKIKDIIKVRYESDIGLPNFKIFPVYD